MSYTSNLSELKNYSKEFAKIIIDKHFAKQETISGNEIMNVTNIKQLNLFILKELFTKWKAESKNIQSPYFDYNSAEVKHAMEDFMNVLSRFILVKKEEFEPIIASATFDTMQLYLDPELFFKQELRELADFKLSKDWLKNNGKFYKDYNWVLVELLNRVNGMSYVYANEGIDWLKDIISPDKIEDHKDELAEIEKTIGTKHTVSYPSNKSSFFDTINHEKTALIEKGKEYTNSEINTLSLTNAEAVVRIEKEMINEKAMPEKFESQTLNDKLQNIQKDSLADFHQKRKIDSIKGNISLNQKFLFINNLFNGEISEFNSAIDELETCHNFNDAKAQMIKTYLPKYHWNLNSAEVEEFFDLLKRRFN